MVLPAENSGKRQFTYGGRDQKVKSHKPPKKWWNYLTAVFLTGATKLLISFAPFSLVPAPPRWRRPN
jgi:hypothetical protein